MALKSLWTLCCGVLLAALFRATPIGASAVALTASAERHRGRHRHGHHSHHGHQRRHGREARHREHRHKRHHKHRQRGDQAQDSGGGDEISVSAALDYMPTKVGEMFAQFQATRDVAKAADVLTNLNVVYESAMTQKDMLTPDCEDKRSELAREVSIARMGLKDVEGHMTRLQAHTQSIQSSNDRSLVEIESLREQYEDHKALCLKNKADSANMLAQLQKDMPLAKNLTDAATKGSTVPTLVECSLPNGDFLTTFKIDKLRKMVSNFSGVTEKMIALNLDRAVRSRVKVKSPSAGASASFVQLRSQRLRGSTADHRAHRRHRRKNRAAPAAKGVGLLQRYLAHRRVPKEWCSDVAPAPSSEAFSDSMATFLGNVEDLVRDLLGKSQGQEEHCRASLETYDEEIKALRRQADDANVALANAAAENSELATLRRERRAQVSDVSQEAEREVATCGQQLQDFEATLLSAKKLKKELGDKAGKGQFLGDCEVGDWVRGPCSETCGTKGKQTLTRDVIISPGPKASCPSLNFTRACNRRPCPVDGQMGHWEQWSGCSRACGGGTRARHRQVLKEARYGGLPTAETIQEQLCNTQPCDQDCILANWTAWTNCSKVCAHGHKSRTRTVLRPALGQGTCPDERSSERLETKACARKSCKKKLGNEKPQCSAEVDVTLVLDVSGSAGTAGTDKMKKFAQTVMGRVKLATKETLGATLGLVFFGSKASVASPLSATSSELGKSLDSISWQKTSTNTAQALGLARELFEQRGRPQAQKVVIVATDGMPESAFLTGVEVARLKEQGVRVAFVAVGSSVSRPVLRRWASWPWEENLMSASSFDGLDDKKVTETLANICGPDFA